MGKEKLLLFKLTQKFKTFLVISIEIIHEGFWLGIMNNSNLTEITQIYFSSAQLYQNDEYNLSGFFNWEKRVIDRYFKDCQNVLVGAAGGGREIIALSNLGMKVDAFECNPRLVDECRRLLDKVGIEASVIPTTPDNVPEKFGIYDGIIVGMSAYMHIIGSDTRIRFLEQCREHIKPEGPILLSFFIFHGNSRYQSLVLKIANFFRSLRRSKEALEFGDSLKFAGFCHIFSQEEIEDEFNKAGFHLLHFSGDDYPHAVGKAV